jgi:cobalt-zinc-cadmium efflux system outer membrane protein
MHLESLRAAQPVNLRAARKVARYVAQLALALVVCGLHIVVRIEARAQNAPPQEHQHNATQPAASVDAKQSNLPTVTLAELERMAMQTNPTLGQAEAAIRAAAGRRKQAGLFPNPTIGYQGDELAFRALSNKSEHFFFIEQAIPLGGKLKKSQRIFEQEQSQATADAEAQKLRVLNAIRALYYERLGAQQLIDLRTELARISREAVSTTGALLNIGQADRPDYFESEIEAERAALEQLNAENESDRLWQLLAAVVGNPSLKPMRLAGDLEKEIPALDAEALLAALLRDSPELKIARVGVERARATIESARAERAPDLFLRGGIGYSTELLEARNGLPPRRTGPEANVEVGIRLPIFNRNQGNLAAAQAELTVAEREVQRVELILRARFASAFTGYVNARRVVERYQQVVLPRAAKAYELYLASFKQMAAAYPQVLIAQRTMFQGRAD